MASFARSLVRSSARPQGLVSIPDAGFDRRNAFSYSRHLELRRIRKSGLTGDHDTIKNSDDLARIPSPKIRLTMLGYNHSLPCEMGSIILTEISTPVPGRTQSNHNNANARKRIISFQLHMKKKSNNEVYIPDIRPQLYLSPIFVFPFSR